MKATKKRFFSLLLSVAMCLTVLPSATNVRAEDVTVPVAEIVSVEELEDGTTLFTYEFDVTPDSVDENGYGVATVSSYTIALDQTFTMTGNYHRGADRRYNANRMRYSMTVTDPDGNPVDKQALIQLWDYNHGDFLIENLINADGATLTIGQVDIVPNRYYYFKYYLAYSADGTSNLKIRMRVAIWTE